jgi:hypothetical protein
MSLSETSTSAVNSSSRVSVSLMVPFREFKLPMTLPGKRRSNKRCFSKLSVNLKDEMQTEQESSEPKLPRVERRRGCKRTLELGRSDDLDGHDRLEDDGLGLVEYLSDGLNGGGDESKLRRINCVESSVLEDVSDAGDGRAVEGSLLEGDSETLQTKNKGKSK